MDYLGEVRIQIGDNVFMNRLHKAISQLVRSSPFLLSGSEKVSYAQRIWTSQRPITAEQTMQHVLPTTMQTQPWSNPSITANSQTNPWQVQPSQVDWNKQGWQPDLAIEELTKHMSQLQVQLAKLTQGQGPSQR